MKNSFLTYFNRLIPFATPGVPLLQDLCHLAAICILLYFAPQLQERFQASRRDFTDSITEQETTTPVGIELPPVAGHEDEQQPQWDARDVDVAQPEAIDGQAGPANVANANRPLPAQRTVAGTKKAQSLARKDERRAYNEWLRSQGDLQRARESEGAEEREKALAAERERRHAAEVALETKRGEERRKRKLKEESERLEEMRRREQTVQIVKEELEARKACDLFKVAKEVGGDVDEEWVEQILLASGVIGRKGDSLTMVTKMGWAVKVTAADMSRMYEAVVENNVGDANGSVEYNDLGKVLDGWFRTRHE